MTEGNLFDRDVLSVSELTGRLQDVIESEFGLVWLVGEISTLRRPSSGHYYFILKDKDAQIRAVMFRNKQHYLGFDLEEGREVLCRGRISIYAPRGEYQIILEYMEPLGEGALRLAFEKLKQRLAEEGLFDESRKKKLPLIPERVAVVTSPTGAAIRDFIRVSRRRFNNTAISVYPVRVQGEGSAAEIAQALNDLNKWGGFDVIVVARGGGSLEDLWAFNEEITARAIAASKIPVVSAVGHEIDYTISDFVSDLRAPTPSAAAEIIFREKKELQTYLNSARRRLTANIKSRTELTRERLAHLQTRLGDPGRFIAEYRLSLDDKTEQLTGLTVGVLSECRRRLENAGYRLTPASPANRLAVNKAKLNQYERDLKRLGTQAPELARRKLAGIAARLNDLSPLAVLERGYALARKRPGMKALKSSHDASPGDSLNILLARGEINVTVDEVIE